MAASCSRAKGALGRILGFIGSCVLVLALPSCSLLRKYFERVEVVTVTETKDSIIVRDRVIHDTVKVEIPVYVEVNVTKADSSHLENPFAVSDAWVKDGLLYHNLRTKHQTIEAPVDIHVADTTKTHDAYERRDSTAVRTEIKEVEKPLSRWKSFKLGAFWWLILSILVQLGWIFRKPLLKLLF